MVCLLVDVVGTEVVEDVETTEVVVVVDLVISSVGCEGKANKSKLVLVAFAKRVSIDAGEGMEKMVGPV